MIRSLKIVLAVFLLGGLFGTAHAQSGPWTVTEVSGRVTLRDDNGAQAVSRGKTVIPGTVIETGPGARAVIVQGRNFVTIAPDSRIRVPAPQARESGLFDLLHEWGNAIFQIEKKPDPHFSVGTPYLAAVVKGTTFSITVSPEGTSLQVTEGAVETSTLDGGARDLIRPGIVAIVSASDRYRLTVQGQNSKTIDSPRRTGTEADRAAPPSNSEASPVPEPTAPSEAPIPPISGTAPDPLVADQAAMTPTAASVPADASPFTGQLILDPVVSAPTNLAALTGGLVGGTTGGQAANVEVAFARDAARHADALSPSAPGGDNANKNPGNGNGPDAPEAGSTWRAAAITSAPRTPARFGSNGNT